MKTPMKISAVRSLIVISLVAALVVAGTTMSWFTDEYNLPSAAEMVMGTLDFEITSPSVITEGDDEGQPLTWVAGKCKKLSWTFKNTGTKTAFFRARPEDKYIGKDSAWGKGTPFNEGQQGNWAMYFTHNPGSVTVMSLIAGQHDNAGTVTVWEEGGKLYVKIQTKDDWKMIESHVHLAETVDDFPLNGNGNGNGKGNGKGNQNPGPKNPSPGQFDYKEYHCLAESYTYEIDLPGFSPALIAVHACLVQGTETTETDEGTINWTLPDDSPWKKGSDGWYYYCRPVRSGEESTLVLRGCLSEEAGGGACSVQLEAESVQASNEAAVKEWPGWPGE